MMLMTDIFRSKTQKNIFVLQVVHKQYRTTVSVPLF